MATREVYRIQPVGLELGGHRSTTSNDNLDCGVHVCCSLEEMAGAVNGWCKQDYVPELVVIECEDKDVQDNGDYEGFVLKGNRGQIVRRVAFSSWDELVNCCKSYSLSLLVNV